MNRVGQLTFRTANAALIGALRWLHGSYDVPTTYRVSKVGAAALFEGAWFSYHPREFGCTGNIDLEPYAENATRAAMFSRIRDGQVIYDIGAHGGVYTITLRNRFPNVQVYSFEPQPEDLLANLRLNDLSTRNVHEVAVGAATGVVKMTTGRRSSNHVAKTGDREVPMVVLDEYIKEKDLPDPNWIKIDIEGLEYPALKGAQKILRRARPTVICEINHLLGRFGTTVPDFLSYMGMLGYSAYRLGDERLEQVTNAHDLASLGKSADDNFWFIHSTADVAAQT